MRFGCRFLFRRKFQPVYMGTLHNHARMLNFGLAFPESPRTATRNEQVSEGSTIFSIEGRIRTDDGVIGSRGGGFGDRHRDISIGELETLCKWMV